VIGAVVVGVKVSLLPATQYENAALASFVSTLAAVA
jgi:hypothetical protein